MRRAIYFIYITITPCHCEEPEGRRSNPLVNLEIASDFRCYRISTLAMKESETLCTELILVENYEPTTQGRLSCSRAGLIVVATTAGWASLICLTASAQFQSPSILIYLKRYWMSLPISALSGSCK